MDQQVFIQQPAAFQPQGVRMDGYDAEAHFFIQVPRPIVALRKFQFHLGDVRVGFRQADQFLKHAGADAQAPEFPEQGNGHHRPMTGFDAGVKLNLAGTGHLPVHQAHQHGFGGRCVFPGEQRFFPFRGVFAALLGIANDEFRFSGGLNQVLQRAGHVFLPGAAQKGRATVPQGEQNVLDLHGSYAPFGRITTPRFSFGNRQKARAGR